MKYLLYILLAFTAVSCGIYNFTGGSTGDAKTFQVNFFRNDAPLVEPGLDRDFTIALQDLINNQTINHLIGIFHLYHEAKNEQIPTIYQRVNQTIV